MIPVISSNANLDCKKYPLKKW